MPQVLKPELRQRILISGLEVFAERGYPGATMSAIAERAGLGAASLYRYFPSKTELFGAVVTPEIAREFRSLLDRRVRALAQISLAGANPSSGDYGPELLQFWFENRLAVAVLLDHAEGTAYETYGEQFVAQLVKGTLEQLREVAPALVVTAAARFVLTCIFDNTRRTLAAILVKNPSEAALRETVQAFWSYQIPGLRGLADWVQGQQAMLSLS